MMLVAAHKIHRSLRDDETRPRSRLLAVDAANIRDIANRSGLSPGTFYNYYRTKEAIFEALSQGATQPAPGGGPRVACQKRRTSKNSSFVATIPTSILWSRLIIAAGAEAVFRLNREPRASMKYLRDFLPKFMLNGLTGWNASAAAKSCA